MRALLLAMGLIAAASSAASAQYVFGGCPQPALRRFVEVARPPATCLAHLDRPEDLRRCGIELGDARDAIQPAPALHSKLARARDGRHRVVQIWSGRREIATWTSGGLVDCVSRVFVSPDRETIAAEIVLDRMPLRPPDQGERLLVVHLTRPLPPW